MKQLLSIGCCVVLLASCTRENLVDPSIERSNSLAKKEIPMFSEIGSIDLGTTGAAEISSFDPSTNKLFVVNNTDGNNRIDVVDLSDPNTPAFITSISVAPYGGLVNSVSVSQGKVAAAIENNSKTANGKVVVFNTTDYTVIANVTVGALPDMVTFTPDGKYILSANEGEPNSSYSNDPEGTVSIINVANNYAVTTLNFAAFASQEEALKAKGLRVSGLNASFAQDIEPEYIAVAANSKTAWVSLQENNAIARIDIEAQNITDIFPLGYKDYSLAENAMDLSDSDGEVSFKTAPVQGVFMPDGIAVYTDNNIPFVFSANEGDAREYNTFADIKRIKSVTLDPTVFPNAATLKQDANLGRLNMISTLGDIENDNDYDELYSFGARSFSIWNGNSGKLVFDSKNELDRKAYEHGFYDDGRSDDKGSEPEGVVLGRVGNKNLLFVGLERADAIAIYDASNPNKPVFLQMIACGDAPEGLLFVHAAESPNGKSLLIVSSENDGQVKVFEASSN